MKDMTRGEEIVKEAELCASANTQIIGDWGEHYLGFIHGAEWADRSMITKACEWLRNNWHKYINIDADGVVCFGHWENDFRKAMKENNYDYNDRIY